MPRVHTLVRFEFPPFLHHFVAVVKFQNCFRVVILFEFVLFFGTQMFYQCYFSGICNFEWFLLVQSLSKLLPWCNFWAFWQRTFRNMFCILRIPFCSALKWGFNMFLCDILQEFLVPIGWMMFYKWKGCVKNY